jgi:hypothetical protein
VAARLISCWDSTFIEFVISRFYPHTNDAQYQNTTTKDEKADVKGLSFLTRIKLLFHLRNLSMRTKAFAAALAASFSASAAIAVAEDAKPYPPSGFYSYYALNDEFGESNIRTLKRSVDEINKALAAASKPPIGFQLTDFCYAAFYYQDDQGKFAVYHIKSDAFPIRYVRTSTGQCTYDAAKRQESCRAQSLDGSQSYVTVYPKDSFTESYTATAPGTVYKTVACDSEAANLTKLMQDTEEELGRGSTNFQATFEAATVVRVMMAEPQLWDVLKKHYGDGQR